MLFKYSFHTDPEIDHELKRDFTQDLLLILLEYKKPECIVKLYHKKQLGYFILRIIGNNIRSEKSPYYRNYGKYQTKKVSLQDWTRGKNDRM